MEEARSKSSSVLFFALLPVVLLLGLVYGFTRYRDLSSELASTKSAKQASDEALARGTALFEASTTELLSRLASTTDEKRELQQRLGIAIDDNSSLSHQMSMTQNQLEVLDKLRKIDPELLEKYSKIFFLNENYTPAGLATITPSLVSDQKKSLRIHADVQPFLEKMMRDAAASAHPLLLISAYRSFKDQTALKSAYSMSFGSGANKFSADQGYSEHQLGTTVDFTTPLLGANFSSFADSGAYTWLLDNAYKYGFVLSYPKNNSYYVYEPWHWRFVGVVLSARLHQEGKNFYDLDQREIDSYLIDIFSLKETMK